jgi:hypothetical protein
MNKLFQNHIELQTNKNLPSSLAFYRSGCPTDGYILKFSLHSSAAHFVSFEKRSRIERESIEIPISTLKIVMLELEQISEIYQGLKFTIVSVLEL